jgi:membrane fusion protein, copper/silver efflux system
MHDSVENTPQSTEMSAPDGATSPSHRPASRPQRADDRRENRRWWFKLVLQPVLFLLCGVVLIVVLGFAQRAGWISAVGSGGGHSHASAGGENVSYICPMMCTPPQAEPGRCPVCAMELVPATAGAGKTDRQAVQIDPAARRVANIRTVSVRSIPLTRTVRAVGELNYNEGSLKTISAYVDGRLEQLYADYTGMVVDKGDRLALVYSPKLYSAQVEYLLAKKARDDNRTSASQRLTQPNLTLHQNARRRLIELGMTEPQIEQLEQAGQAGSRLHLYAPSSGTVIEKFAVEGQYVKEGEPIYRLADLSTVWLMLRLFPEDAATIRYGQKVEAEVQSLPGRKFTGRVAFIDPSVNPQSRTVGVRVVIPNDDGLLRAGDFARAVIEVPLVDHDQPQRNIYDPELASQWISPRHPHVIEPAPGSCRECGVALVPASQLGFTDVPAAQSQVLVVPRDAVLMAGSHSVVYVETEPGRFEIRQVVLGPGSGDQIAVLSGLQEGEQVAARGNFLIDSQMQLAGNPSLIDPTKAQPKADDLEMDKIMVALADLSQPDRQAAIGQRICPVTEMALGSMGTPPKVALNGDTVFICCKACEGRLRDDPDKYLANLTHHGEKGKADPAIIAALAKLPADDRALAEKQRICPVAEFPLGSMGTPKKVDVQGTPIFICCEACRDRLVREPDKYRTKIANRPIEDRGRKSKESQRDRGTDAPPATINRGGDRHEEHRR